MASDCAEVTCEVVDDEEAREIARTLNEDRRQLTRDQRLPIVKALREEGHSFRAIGGALGVSKSQAERDLKDELSHPGQFKEPERITGLDGKSRPALHAKPEPKQQPRNGLRRDKTAPFLGSARRSSRPLTPRSGERDLRHGRRSQDRRRAYSVASSRARSAYGFETSAAAFSMR